MPGNVEALLGAGQQALEAGDWKRARDSFAAALDEEESAAALLGLGTALWWLEDVDESLRCRERAYAEFRRAGEPLAAGTVALELCAHYAGNLGNHAAARGWLARLSGLVEQHELEPLEGWVLFVRAALANDTGDPVAGERFAREARERGRDRADADLELCAMAQVGAALVMRGRVEAGTALLDEAMAGALGGEGRPDTVVHASCVTIICCSMAQDLKRAAQWIRAAEEFNRRYGSSHLYALCRTHYGGILFAMGRWEEAEEELRAALDTSRTAEPVIYAEALAKLAELRLAQGRVEEAERLLEGFGDQAALARVRAAIHIARDEPAVAAAILSRRLRELESEGLEAAALLELLAAVELGQGRTDEARAHVVQLAQLAEEIDSEALAGYAQRALGRAGGDDAAGHLERALAIFARLEMPLEAARTRLLLASASAPNAPEAAVAEARGALTSFEALGAAGDADLAARFLRDLGVKAARAGARGADVLTKRELEVLALLGEGLSNRELAKRLFISRKTAENHVANILSKLGLGSRAQAAAYAVRHLEGRREPAAK